MKITRYRNRKLYLEGQYLDLQDIKRYAKEGREFQVIDFSTKNDITADILKRAVSYTTASREALLKFIRENA